MCSSDLILSDIIGIYDKSPVENKDAKLIELVKNPDALEKKISIGGNSSFGTGGIATKIEAAKIVTPYGTSLIVARGKQKNIILDLSEGKEKGTLFLGK